MTDFPVSNVLANKRVYYHDWYLCIKMLKLCVWVRLNRHLKMLSRTETDMMLLLVLFDIAMSKLSNDMENTISARCVNMTLFHMDCHKY